MANNKNKNVAGAPPANPISNSPPPPVPSEETIIPHIAEVEKEAFDLATAAFKKHPFDRDVAEEMKNEFHNRDGPTWNRTIGRNFEIMNPPNLACCPTCNVHLNSLTTPLEHMCPKCIIGAAKFARNIALQYEDLMQQNRKLMAKNQSLVAEYLMVSASSSSQIQKKNDPRYKTILCTNWEKNTRCRYRNKCLYAHGIGELKDKEMCILFEDTRSCPRGTTCPFRH